MPHQARIIAARCRLLVGGCLAMLAVPLCQNARADEGGSAATPVEDVVVTARFRPERLQSVPIAISQIDRHDLDSNPGAISVLQLAQKVPALQIQSYSAKNTTITIRGLGNNSGTSNEGLEQGVGLYIDGVFYAKPAIALSDLTNVDTISILRGPQGTLFGKNTAAGAIDIHTLKPSFDFGTQGSVSVGNYDYERIEGSVTGPLTSTLAARLTVGARHRGGTIDNVTYGQKWDDHSSQSVRLDLLFQPTDNLTARLIGDYARESGNFGFLVVKDALPATLANGSHVRDLYQRAADTGYSPLPVDPFARKVDINSAQYGRIYSGGVSGQIDWSAGDFKLTSITAWRRFTYSPGFDGDGMGVTVQTRNIVQIRNDQFSQELRLASPSGKAVEYTLGGYYYSSSARDDHITSFGPDASAWYYGPTYSPAVLNGLVSREHYDPQTRSLSAFGQFSWHPVEAVDLGAGLRFTHEKRSGSYLATVEGGAAPIAILPSAQQIAATAARANYAPTGSYYSETQTDRLSGTVSASYHPAKDVLLYASYSWGFKSAGLNLVKAQPGISPIVRPERVSSYEAGLKSSFLDHRLTANLTLFWTEDRDFQATIYGPTSDGRSISYISNINKVRSRGAEVELAVRPVAGLTFGFSGSYDDARYVSYSNAPCAYLNSYLGICDLSGRPLSGVSRWAGTASVDYSRPVGKALEAFAGGDYSFRSGFYAAPNDDPFTYIAGYGVADLHLGLRRLDGRWTATLWSRNLFDRHYYNTIAINSSFGISQAVVGDPRTIGATLAWKL